jgi:hypothetical protein
MDRMFAETQSTFADNSRGFVFNSLWKVALLVCLQAVIFPAIVFAQNNVAVTIAAPTSGVSVGASISASVSGLYISPAEDPDGEQITSSWITCNLNNSQVGSWSGAFTGSQGIWQTESKTITFTTPSSTGTYVLTCDATVTISGGRIQAHLQGAKPLILLLQHVPEILMPI